MQKRYYKDSIGNKIFDIFNYIFLGLIIFIMLYPFINQLAISLNDSTDAIKGGIYFFPRKFSLDAYKFVFDNPKLLRGAIISVLRVVVGTSTSVLATSLLAYIITIKDFSGKKFMRRIFVFTMFFSGGLIPTYLLFVKLGLTDTFHVYWIPSLFSAYYMLMIASYMQGIPNSLIQSARIDGASELRIYWSIMLPLSIPVIAAICVFTGVGHWNDWFTVSIYNPSGQWDTLQIFLKRMLLEAETLATLQNQQMAASQYATLTPETVRAATTMVVTVPIAIIYPFFQKYFISGITVGAVKE
ncbi:MAG: carbohydrate ABC transporter permease [Clostridium sp.]|nr:carbohydrate ABC transporter permease [Clostridium sp.]MDU7084235.1 carbohydrate ABC transporter permease [Clostridium sp.]